MSTTAEINPIVAETPAVVPTTSVPEVTPTEDPIVEKPVLEEKEAPVSAETEEEEETADSAAAAVAVVTPVTEEVAAKPTVTKRRTIFNPFGKSPKKEEIKEDVAVLTEEPAATTPSSSTEEKVKKPTKAFGFFSRSKSTPKVNDEETVAVEAEAPVIATELPQIEHLQPMETENVTGGSETESPTIAVKEAVAEVAENVEQQVTSATQEVEQTAANLTTSATNKRQSFISKLFGGGNKSKKQQEAVAAAASVSTTAAAGDEEATTPVVAEADTTTTTVAEEVTEQQTEEEEAHQRPSSPLGRLTELFSKKTGKKASKEETPAVVVTDVEQDVAQTTIEENTNVTATPVVTASA